MKERVQGCVTVGVAMVGAGALALAPMAPQPAVQMRAVEVSKVNLLAETLPTTLQAKLAELGAGVGESGLRLAQSSLQGLLGPIALAQALGDDEAVKAIIADYVDGPLYVADPTIFALDNVLPAPFGGDTQPRPCSAPAATYSSSASRCSMHSAKRSRTHWESSPRRAVSR